MDNLTTRIKGFTAWVNLRLAPSGVFTHNILEDILKGKNMKILLESMTGKPFKKLQSFDGLTEEQKITRVEWMVRELKDKKIILPEVRIDTQMFAMRSSTQVFELLWCLVCHDIWYVWEKSFILQQADERELISEPFSWVPSPSHSSSRQSGMTSSSTEKTSDQVNSGKSSQSSGGKKSPKSRQHYPEPDSCILDMINAHLKMSREGRMLTRGVMSLDDLTDSRVLCALVNSFVPETFTTEVLLNDRWTINLALQTANEFFKSSSPFDATDLVQGDIMSVCSYFAFFFMCGYKMKQSRAMLKRMDELMLSKVGVKHELEKLEMPCEGQDEGRKQELEYTIAEFEAEILELEENHDLSQCSTWMKDIANVQNKVRSIVSKRNQDKFDIIRVPRNMTINDLTVSLIINLSLTSGVGFYHMKNNETLSKDRKIVILVNETGEFKDDLQESSSEKVSVRKFLGLTKDEVAEVNPDSYPEYKIFVQSSSRNKILKAGSLFLYQIFPGNTLPGQRLFFKAAKTAELDTMQKLVSFFQSDRTFIDSKELGSGNTALHIACRQGHFDIVQYLLEKGADINATNNMNFTPFFAAVGNKKKGVAELLIEWGADIYKKNNAGKTAFDIIKNEELKKALMVKENSMRDLVAQVINGDTEKLTEVIEAQCEGGNILRSLRSRCIRGSTLLHAAALYGFTSLVKTLLRERIDVNLLDYKGATALHRVKDAETLKVLLEAGGDIDAVDDDGNSPLHVTCYGEDGNPSELALIEIQLKHGPSLTAKNKKGMLALHCCAIQGRDDAIELLLRYDTQQLQKKDLAMENQMAPSPVYLAIANDHLDCGVWLSQNGFEFVRNETDELLEKILRDEFPCSDCLAAVTFLLDHGASANHNYGEGNTALHFVAANKDMSDILKLLIARNADVDSLNVEMFSPLFFATQNSCIYNACILIMNGANAKVKNLQGLTAFDFVIDFDEWINSGYFDEETQARLKAYSFKHSRDLVRAITRKVKSITPTTPQIPSLPTSFKGGRSPPSPRRQIPTQLGITFS